MAERRPKHESPIRIGISACLLGQKVRYDGGHKLDRYITETLGKYFEWVPVCPEVELGLGTPRPTMRLEKVGGGTRLIIHECKLDLTARMTAFSSGRLKQLTAEDLCGYILKSDSPSCGMERVRVYGHSGSPSRNGRGLFAEALLAEMPQLPVEEEGRLCDPGLRENWIERVFAYSRLKSLWRTGWSAGDLVGFHTVNKLAVLAHSPAAYERLGRIVGRAGRTSKHELQRHYQTEYMNALRTMATRGKNANVLQHMAGYFKRRLDESSRRELAELIDDYRRGETPLIVPITIVKHYVRSFNLSYLASQTYPNPHPKELALRSSI